MPIHIKKIHHIAIICSDYKRSLHFYTQLLGLTLLTETYRSQRDSYKADLALNGHYIIELFSFPNPPSRPSYPEAAGLRHLAFEVDDIQATFVFLQENQIDCETIRIDNLTQKKFFFIADPDGLPIEFYQSS
ncbi:SMU1112c/YaeR family gloxylase I-like metalloprotein [Sphingobacterium sp. LRF_L2]|uniref:SMU1112c/YaeR family gloxylase I-like metalloprotein n=1 Tax=Sphingobacterium sp. LRF_L2 TaxID=3369421 RepID=UPI003F60A59C